MADEADLAFYAEQGHLTQALAARPQHGPAPRPAGYCHNCCSTDVGVRLFCDSDCAADWEYQDRLRRKLGLRPARALTRPIRALAGFAR
jgi:hypothetical protein